ncbi:MAG: DUF4249 domain-containing protein [Ignavibacteriales bacterium]|nr:DUF4249 domain-containing protein [Ignavibacteriales bacterium]MCF8314648.1 DUF4249 domain-containing protein [Ignavibacteriales bacterium]MCF8436315.1 DUF4249 domain-containing protein [Ignavibacteriales bacterium]
MKKLILICVILLSFFSCESSFDPNADFRQDYAVYFILNGDQTYQTAQLIKSSPDKNGVSQIETGIPGAEFRLIYDNSEYILKDSVSAENPGKNYYTINNFKPAPGKNIRLNVKTPDGKILTSETDTPLSIKIQFLEGTDEYVPNGLSRIAFVWKVLDAPPEGQFYLPRLVIKYYYTDSGVKSYHSKEVPVSLTYQSGKIFENYPTPIAGNYLIYDWEAFDYAFERLTLADTARNNYTVINAEFELILMDKSMTSYYMSSKSFEEGFSIILDQTEFTNITGGFGVFGSYFSAKNYKLRIISDYIIARGYKRE